MPELPEVETVRRGLKGLIVGRRVESVSFDWPKGFPNSQSDIEAFLVGSTVTDVRRRAKVLMIDLSTEYTLVTHLKMTGQLVYVEGSTRAASSRHAHARRGEAGVASLQSVELASLRQSSTGQEATPVPPGLARNDDEDSASSASAGVVYVKEGFTPPLGSEVNSEPSPHPLKLARSARADATRSLDSPDLRFGAGHPNESLVGELPDRSTRVIITFTDGSRLFFNDQRKFGWMKLFPSIEVSNIDFMKKVGPEPLEDDFTPEMFYERLQRRKNTTIKAAILDQTVLAGVGNIYADEGLWGAKIHPATRVKNVPKEQIYELWREIREVMLLAIEKGGSTDKNYVSAEGKRGSYLDFARVFRREGLPCLRHPDVLIEKTKVAGRGTHTCSVCQVEVV